MLWPTLATIILILCLGSLSYYGYWYVVKTDRPAFAGKVVEKRTNRRESDFGGSIDRLLILEDESGVRTAVIVGEQAFAQAEIGKWVQRDLSGTKWYDANPQAAKK